MDGFLGIRSPWSRQTGPVRTGRRHAIPPSSDLLSFKQFGLVVTEPIRCYGVDLSHQPTKEGAMTDVLTKPHQLIASDRVEGTAVRRPNGDKLGHIERLMIDKISGKVSYAILSFGGFLGMGA